MPIQRVTPMMMLRLCCATWASRLRRTAVGAIVCGGAEQLKGTRWSSDFVEKGAGTLKPYLIRDMVAQLRAHDLVPPGLE